jgi:ribonuclease Z
MRPLLHPTLLNGRTGDAALYLEMLFEKRAIMFDLGDIASLRPRRIQRLDHVFVSHAHLDHFFGFDRLLRVLVDRDKEINFYGPQDFIEHVHHKLQSYRWNLVEHTLCDLVFVVTEINASLAYRTAQFRLKNGFIMESLADGVVKEGILYSESEFRVSTAVLEHRTPCLGFAVEEAAHVNIDKDRMPKFGLHIGPWLQDLKRAITQNSPDDYVIQMDEGREMPLERLRDLVTVTPGQKIAYVTDVADTPSNRKAIVELARGADILFIEATFAKADALLAAERAHLTTAAAGEIARAAHVHRVEPFHFSSRYEGEEEEMLKEVLTAFAGGASMDER